MKKIILNAIACILLISTVACSKKTTATNNNQNTQGQNRSQNRQQPRGGERPEFSELLSKMDTNGDKKLSKAEIQGPLKNNFDKIDTDGNGFITAEEFKNAPSPKRRGRN
ncbi:MAG: EF-hand domain-containing protein [Saprospiraceae bacterium]